MCQEDYQSVKMFRLQEMSEVGNIREVFGSRGDLGVLLKQKG